jgi:hypothetical protein
MEAEALQTDQQQEATMRNPGRPTRQVTLVPPTIDVKLGRPPPPDGFSSAERVLWEKLILSRRPCWFDGAETLLASFVTATIACQRLEAQMRKAHVGVGDRFLKLSRAHRQTAQLAANLATKLRLAPSSKIDKNVAPDGGRPLANMGMGQPVARDPDDAHGNERSFATLRARQDDRAFRHMIDEPPALQATLAAIEAPDGDAAQ